MSAEDVVNQIRRANDLRDAAAMHLKFLPSDHFFGDTAQKLNQAVKDFDLAQARALKNKSAESSYSGNHPRQS